MELRIGKLSKRHPNGTQPVTVLVSRKETPIMKKLFKGLLFLALAVSSLGAQNDKQISAFGGQPPLIDRELIFGNPEILGAQLSPDGRYLAFLKPWKDTTNIYVKGVDETIFERPKNDTDTIYIELNDRDKAWHDLYK